MTTNERPGKTGRRQPTPRTNRPVGETIDRLPANGRREERIVAAPRRALRRGLGGLLLNTADIRVLRWCCDETTRSTGDDPCLCNYVELL